MIKLRGINISDLCVNLALFFGYKYARKQIHYNEDYRGIQRTLDYNHKETKTQSKMSARGHAYLDTAIKTAKQIIKQQRDYPILIGQARIIWEMSRELVAKGCILCIIHHWIPLTAVGSSCR